MHQRAVITSCMGKQKQAISEGTRGGVHENSRSANGNVARTRRWLEARRRGRFAQADSCATEAIDIQEPR
jgi:hypothetical protein